MSDADIEKGSRGLNELTKALYTMKVGVTCLIPENLDSPWLLFEAGALSKTIDDTSRLCTYLLDGLEPKDVRPPLGMFQATKATKEDTRRLVQTINVSVSEEPLHEEDLDAVFEAMWPSLKATLSSLPLLEAAKTVKRNPEDMLAEILEIVRAEANRKRYETAPVQFNLDDQPASDIEIARVRAIKEGVRQNNKLLGSLIDHVSRWQLAGSEVRVYFAKENRTFAEILQGRDQLQKLRVTAGEVLGFPVRVRVLLDGTP
jgi:hypothetical protein